MWEAERPGNRAFLRHEGVRMRQVWSRRQPSPLRRRFPSCSRAALRPATMTRSRPSFFAWYIAASALAISSSGASPGVGLSAAPPPTVAPPPPLPPPPADLSRRTAGPEALAHGGGRRDRGLDQHDQELLTAVPGHAIHAPCGLAQDLGDLHEHRVPPEVAVRVVVLLEVIDVGQQHRESAPE